MRDGASQSNRRITRKRPAQTILLGSVAIALAVSADANLSRPALAQGAAAQPMAGNVMSLNIRPQDLGGALTAFADRAGLRLLFPSNLVAGKRSPGISGTFTADQALNRLLAGTGLSYRFTSANTVTIMGASAEAAGSSDGSLLLDTINVQGESAWGPVKGFVATRSATGSKTDTPLIENPQSISVVTRDQMDWQGTQELNQGLRYEAGVRAEMSVINRAQEINIRGFQVDGSAQGVFLDGLSLPTRWYGHYNINPYGLERIEVMRGPSSVLYGQNGPGGLVNMVSKRPTTTSFGQMDLATGTHGLAQGGIDIGGPVGGSDQWFYRITGELRDVGSQVDHTRTTRGFVAPALTWKPSSDTTLTLLGNYQKIGRDGGNDQWLPALGTVRPAPYGRIARSFFSGQPGWDEYVQEQVMVGYAFEHRFDENWTVRQNARYSRLDTDYKALITYGWGSNPDGSTNYRALNRYSFGSREVADTVVVDNQVQYKGRTGPIEHTILAGLDYRWSSYDSVLGINFDVPTIDPYNPVYGQAFGLPVAYQDDRQIQRQTGVYIQDQMKIAERLIISLGGRYDWASTTTTNHLNGAVTRQSDGAATWRVGAVYLFDNGIAPYASYSTSFFPQSGTDFYGTPFRPTTGQSYEVGVKYQPQGFKSFFTASLFNMTKQDVPTADPDPLHPFARVQTGEVRSRGFEFSARASLTDNFDLVGSYTYTDLEVTKSNGPDLGKVPFAGVPKHMASIWGDYTIQNGAFAGLGIGAGVRYIGTTQDDGEGLVQVPAATLLDAAIRYDLSKISKQLTGATLTVNATNLLDKTYVASCNNTVTCFYGPGRTIMASLRYRW